MGHHSRMAMEVNKLIGKHLLSKEPLHLPGVGSLYLAAADAQRGVEFSAEPLGCSLVEVISRCASCTEDQALDIYKRWLSESRSDQVIHIEGIGNLNAGVFTTVEPFESRLHELLAHVDEAPIVATPVAPAVESAPQPERETDKKPEEQPKTTVVPPAVFPVRSNDVASAPTRVEPSPKPKKVNRPNRREEEMKEKKSKKMMWVILILLLIIIIGYFGYQYFNSQSQAREKARIELLAQQNAAAQKQKEADSLAKVEADRLAEEKRLAEEAEASPRFMVVYGVFTVESNAAKAVDIVKRQFNATGKIYPFEGRYLVSVFESESRKECQTFFMNHYDDLTDSWIYELK